MDTTADTRTCQRQHQHKMPTPARALTGQPTNMPTPPTAPTGTMNTNGSNKNTNASTTTSADADGIKYNNEQANTSTMPTGTTNMPTPTGTTNASTPPSANYNSEPMSRAMNTPTRAPATAPMPMPPNTRANRTPTGQMTNAPTSPPAPAQHCQLRQTHQCRQVQRTHQHRTNGSNNECANHASVNTIKCGQPHTMNTKLGAFLRLALVNFFITMADIVHSLSHNVGLFFCIIVFDHR